MKNVLWSLFVLLFVITGCDKESRLKTKLEGTWELRSIEGGFRPAGDPSEFGPGNGRTMQFDKGSFKTTFPGQAPNTGKYRVEKSDTELNNEKFRYKLILQHSNYNAELYFKLKGDQLVIHTGPVAADHVIQHYVKISD